MSTKRALGRYRSRNGVFAQTRAVAAKRLLRRRAFWPSTPAPKLPRATSNNAAAAYRKRYLGEGATSFLDKSSDFEQLPSAIADAGHRAAH